MLPSFNKQDEETMNGVVTTTNGDAHSRDNTNKSDGNDEMKNDTSVGSDSTSNVNATPNGKIAPLTYNNNNNNNNNNNHEEEKKDKFPSRLLE